MYKYNKIKKLIDKYEYISFDIFDTLIKRNIDNPNDIFDLVERKYNEQNKHKISNFKQIRIEAAKQASKLSPYREPNLDDIYLEIDMDDKEKLKNLEIDLEMKLCQQNIDFYDIYKYAKEKNKTIIITSDMYLSKDIIQKILKNAQIEYNYLFISNVVKLNKRRGKLFQYITTKLKINTKELLHIGDSTRSDFLIPTFFGIKSVLIPKKINKLKYYTNLKYKNLDENIVINFINNNISLNEDIYYQLGFEILGIILLGYAKWLESQLKQNNIQKIFFLAREGAILKKAFDMLHVGNVESKYLYVSRRSTRATLLKDINNLEDVFLICKMRKAVDLEGFFINVGLDINCYHSLLKKYNLKKYDIVKNIENFEQIFNEFKNDIIENAAREEKNLVEYLKQEGLTGKIAIADIGWAGTMQNSLINISLKNGIKNNITGFYLGELSSAYKNIKNGNKQYGYLFDYKSNESEIRSFLGLFENLFSSNHGTTIKYEKKKKIEPLLAPCEYSKDELKIFDNIQRGALDFIKLFLTLENFDLKYSTDFVMYGLKKLGLQPTLNDIKLFGNITYLDSKKFQLANPEHGFVYYLLKPKSFIHDFLGSSWKVGFLKVIFKLPFPYYKLLIFIYSKMDNKEKI